jgi:hypothetical protein
LVEMSGRGRVLCFADDVYIVPEPALKLLVGLGIDYQELGRGGFDYAEKALRAIVSGSIVAVGDAVGNGIVSEECRMQMLLAI